MDTIMVEAINNTGVRLSVVDVRGDYPKIINLEVLPVELERKCSL